MPTSPEQRRALVLVSAVVVCDYVGVSMMRVTLPFFAQALGGTGKLIGGLETAYGVGQVIGALSLPKLSDTVGRRTILIASCVGSVLGYSIAIMARVAESPALLLASRFPVGLAKQTVTVSRAVVADCTDPDDTRSFWMALLGAALGCGCVVGPFLGGQAAELVGETMPAFISLAIFIILTPTVAVVLPETSKGKKPAEASKKDKEAEKAAAEPGKKSSLWCQWKVVAVLGVLSLPELGLIAHQTVTLYMYSMQNLGKGKAWIGNLASGSALLQTFFSGVFLPFLTKRGWSDVRVLQLGCAAFAAASLLIAFGQTAEAVMLSGLPSSLANAVLRAYAPTFLSKAVSESQQGEAMGLLDLVSSGLRVLAPILTGIVMDAFGATSVFNWQAGVFALAFVLLFGFSGQQRAKAE